MRKLLLAVVMAFFVLTLFSGFTAVPASADVIAMKVRGQMPPISWPFPVGIGVMTVLSNGQPTDMIVVEVSDLPEGNYSSVYSRFETWAEAISLLAEDPYAPGQHAVAMVARPLVFEGRSLMKSANGRWYSMIPRALICDSGAVRNSSGQASFLVSFSIYGNIFGFDADNDLTVNGNASYAVLGAGIHPGAGFMVSIDCPQ